jgi:hypothetical protein
MGCRGIAKGRMSEITMAEQKLPDDIRSYFVEMGARGGHIGGKRRLETITPERRKEIARKAVAARRERKRTTD